MQDGIRYGAVLGEIKGKKLEWRQNLEGLGGFRIAVDHEAGLG